MKNQNLAGLIPRAADGSLRPMCVTLAPRTSIRANRSGVRKFFSALGEYLLGALIAAVVLTLFAVALLRMR